MPSSWIFPKIKWAARAGAVLCVMLCALGVARAGAVAPALVDTLPDSTLVAVYVPSVRQLLEHWEASPFYRFYGDQRAKEFFGPLRGQMEQWKEQLTRQRGVSYDQMVRFFNGSMVLAGVRTPAGSSQPMEWVLMAQHNGDPAVLECLRRAPAAPGAKVQKDSRRRSGLTYEILRITRDKPAGSQQGVPGALKQETEEYHDFFGASVLIHAGQTGRPIEKILDRLAGKEDATAALTGGASWRALAPKADAGADLTLFVNVGPLASWYVDRWQQAMGEGGAFDLKSLQLDDLQAARADLRLESSQARVDLNLLAPSPHQGVAGLLFLPRGQAEPAPVPFVPAGVLYCSRASYPLAEGWGQLMTLLNQAAPVIGGAVQAQLTSLEQQSGVSVQEDLVARLGQRLVHYVLPVTGSRGRMDLRTYAVQLAQPEAFATALRDLLRYGSQGLGAYQVEQSDLTGYALWTIRAGQPGMERPGPAIFYLCVAGDWLLLSQRRAGIEASVDLMKNKGRSLESKPEYQRVQKALAPGRFWDGYADVGSFFRVLESGAFSGVKPSSHGQDWMKIDETAMPPAALWSEYFGPMGSSRLVQGDQLRMQMVVLYPAQLASH